jgi:hypothetical protein
MPESNSHSKIWVIIDQLIMMAHFLPLSTDTPIKDLANLYLKDVWRLHGLPSTEVSDRDTCFQYKFWLPLMELLKVDMRLSTAFHPQTDGKTEKVNQVLEQYLRGYCSYQQNDWGGLLPLVEHTYNSTICESTKMSTFEPNFGFSPRTNWLEAGKHKLDNIGSAEGFENWTSVWLELSEYLDKAQTHQMRWYDKNRLPATGYNIRENVTYGRV